MKNETDTNEVMVVVTWNTKIHFIAISTLIVDIEYTSTVRVQVKFIILLESNKLELERGALIY